MPSSNDATESTTRDLRIRNGNFILICTICDAGFHTGFFEGGGETRG